MAQMLPPLNFHKWIDDNRSVLKPPVGNKKIWEDTKFDVFVVGGPNARKDYHINHSEEFFYQIEGDITLKIVEAGDFRDVHIRQGEIFLLPPLVPHSPQRPADSIGLVIEHKRAEGEHDGLRWYCDHCSEVVYEESFQLVDIVVQLKGAIQGFWADEAKRTCAQCNHVLSK
jgi:3-hydroxyanthranilate 3,4-dioxygenase